MMEYIKDMLFLNFKLNPTDLPYNTQLGIDKRVSNVYKEEFSDSIRLKMDAFLKDLNNRHGLSLSIIKMDIIGNKIEVSINFINNQVIEYELPLTS